MLRPDRPIFRSSLSITKATRAMYPLSSSRERKKKRTTMMGTKLSTVPTPLKIPSMIREWSTSLMCQAVRAPSTTSVRAPMPVSSSPWSQAPMTLKVRKNTRAMIPTKAGMAVYSR